MPYCPKCDMEFIEGITICSDCGGPLVESKEIADAMKKKEQEETLTRLQAEYQAQLKMAEEIAAGGMAGSQSDDSAEDTSSASDKISSARISKGLGRGLPVRVYVKKSQQYDDLKSSASAFFLVGGALIIFAALCWLGIVSLPLGAMGQVIITVLGAASLFVAVKTAKDAKKVEGQIGEEEIQTRKLIRWFTESYSGDQLDEQLSREYKELVPEELSLKRFELIQDILITNHDLSDQSYVDLLAEEIYSSLYPDS